MGVSSLKEEETPSLERGMTTVRNGPAGYRLTFLRTSSTSNTLHAYVITSITIAKRPPNTPAVPLLVHVIHRRKSYGSHRPTNPVEYSLN